MLNAHAEAEGPHPVWIVDARRELCEQMKVFVLIREDQNEHCYVDTSITGVFREEGVAKEMAALERLHARRKGLVVEDDESPDAEWQVSWTVDGHRVD